ncbi:hypothetical protein EIP91_007825 [Steccherinum ochraceum]|uniref:FAD/NAD(P)-binding domain-containing protein n=1 Tax=Steccherinum ochraceum TaxID=92696 RepID=A0A4R0R635_9APHY|nr:hypothetical protein EIP91_007825 [Steccherinum ochraceum]
MTQDTDPRRISLAWLARFADALCAGDSSTTTTLFHPDGWFRDALALSWQFRSLEGSAKIRQYLADKLKPGYITDVKHYEDAWIRPAFYAAGKYGKGIELAFSYETPVAHGKGVARLVWEPLSEQWKALSVCMSITDLTGHEAIDHELGIYGGHTLAWADVAAERRAEVEASPQVLIIGAGHTGLMAAAACKQQNIRALVIERHERVGDLWRKRYPTLVLHTTRRQNELLYQPYPTSWPEFIAKDKYADWLESYVTFQDLVVWTNSQMDGHPVYHDETRSWDVTINQNGHTIIVHPTHIVMATGALGQPFLPNLPGRNLFPGRVCHGAHYQGGPSYAGERIVVVGAGNTAIDICQDLCFHKAKSVTMVQRSVTCVIDGETSARLGRKIWADEAPSEVGDLRFTSLPLGLFKKMQQDRVHEMWEQDAPMFEKLKKGGLELYMGPENEGSLMLVLETGGGYWQDKGGADLIGRGDIKVKQGTTPVEFTANGLLFADGSTLEADSIVFATGYSPMREYATKLFGEDTLRRVREGALYGVNKEGEYNFTHKPTGHPGLWFGAGGVLIARPMARQLALQLKAIELGLMPAEGQQ